MMHRKDCIPLTVRDIALMAKARGIRAQDMPKVWARMDREQKEADWREYREQHNHDRKRRV
jgi:hypothetical protein